MSIFTRTRLPWILATLLLLLNIAVLVVVWLRPGGTEDWRPPHPPRGGLPGELGMDEEGRKRVEGIQKEHFERMAGYHGQIVALRKEAFRDFGKPGLDTAAAVAALGRIGAVQVAAEKDRFYHFLDVLALCTPEQASRFQEIMPDILSRRHQPENRPPGAPGEGPPHHDGPPPHHHPDGPPPR
jgi:hypothetical protein